MGKLLSIEERRFYSMIRGTPLEHRINFKTHGIISINSYRSSNDEKAKILSFQGRNGTTTKSTRTTQ